MPSCTRDGIVVCNVVQCERDAMCNNLLFSSGREHNEREKVKNQSAKSARAFRVGDAMHRYR